MYVCIFMYVYVIWYATCMFIVHVYMPRQSCPLLLYTCAHTLGHTEAYLHLYTCIYMNASIYMHIDTLFM